MLTQLLKDAMPVWQTLRHCTGCHQFEGTFIGARSATGFTAGLEMPQMHPRKLQLVKKKAPIKNLTFKVLNGFF